ncbi:trypsin-like peptidase domain-containing protein [Micromonospora sp. NPDC126480]|uniref:trypsin-like peptidase domain-containing protein n=1 Tax=Micromonospora sp. NPDC126480 TaxID=3155312 RepID=UPI003318BCAC
MGKAWAAIDDQGRFVTVAVLDAAVAASPGWREAFTGVADSLAQAPDGLAYTYADFSAESPWVAYPAEAGPGAEKLFRALGVEYTPVPTAVSPTSAPPRPVSGAPQPVSGPPQLPWAMQAGTIPAQLSAPQPVSPAAGPVRPTVSPSSGPPSDPPPYEPFTAPVRRIQPSAVPKRRTGLWVGVATAVLVLVAAGGGLVYLAGSSDDQPDPSAAAVPTAFPTVEPVNAAIKPWASVPPYSAQERALAVASPSLVFLEVVVTGYLRDRTTNAPLRDAPVSFNRRCSGFAVTPNGHVVTSASCAKPDEATARQAALDAHAHALVRENKLAANQIGGFVQANLAKTRFTGTDPAAEPASKVNGQSNYAKGGAVQPQAIPGEVVGASAPDAGNTALVKLSREGLPAVELTDSATIEVGGSLLIVGYDSADADVYWPRARLVVVTDTERRGSSPVYRINGDAGRAAYGGVALDPTGRVVGMLDVDPSRADKASRLVVPVAAALGTLGESGVKSQISDSDRRYRAGLDAYFSGDEAAAVSHFDQVVTAAPANVLAQAYRQNAVERQRLKGDDTSTGSSGPGLLLAGLVGALIVALPLLVVVLLRRRRYGR